MKKLKYILLSIFSVLCFGAVTFAFKQGSNRADAAPISKPSLVEWDTDKKIIYANLNSLLIVEDGTGTTVYLDLPDGANLSTSYQTGDGILTSADMSLADLYANTPENYTTEAPADGADLSEWVLVLGANNLDGTIQAGTTMKVTMTGGAIKGIYNGCSSFQAESVSSVIASVQVNISGGSVVDIHTDFGYMNEYAGSTVGSKDITFNLTGGTIHNITRGKIPANSYNFGSKLNLGADVVISGGIDMSTYTKGTMIHLISALSNSASIAFNLGENFVRSNELLNVPEALMEGFDTSKIVIKNPPAEASGWTVYKNAQPEISSTIRYGFDVKVATAEISGICKVGETLTLNYTPAEAAFKSVSWYILDKVTQNTVWISTGLTCELDASEGGDYVYVKAVDKNDNTNIFTLKTSSPIQRVELPEVIAKNGKVSVYANGNDLLVRGNNSNSTIYIDLGTIGKYDAGVDISLYSADVSGAYPDDSNLTNVTIYAGCSTYKIVDEKKVYDNTGNVSITVLSGHIKGIISDSIEKNKSLIYGYVEINLFGGIVESVAPNTKKVNGEVAVNLSGDVNAKIYAPNAELGGAEINIVGKLTCAADSIVILLDKQILNGSPCVKGDVLENCDTTKFAFESTEGYALDSVNLLLLTDLLELVYDVVKVHEIKIVGKVKVGSTLTVQTNPLGSYIVVKWYRSTSKHPYFATLIEGVSGSSYTLTEEDEGKYIYVEVSDGYNVNVSFTSITTKKVGPRVMPAGMVWLVVVVSVLAALIVAFVLWFVLWKKLIVGALFMAPVFEKLDRWLFSKKKNTEETSSQKPSHKSSQKSNKKPQPKTPQKKK